MSTPEEIEEDAALWVIRLERGLTGVEQDAFLQWLAADDRHGKELGRQKANWTRLDVLADWRPEHTVRPNCDLLTPAIPIRRPWLAHKARWFTALGVAAAAVFIFGLTYLQRESKSTSGAPPFPTQLAAIERRVLEDGSVIELNREAEVSVLYTASERTVRLDRGEATFHVAKNPERPFVVSVDGVNLRAVGTAFNVRRDAVSVELIVTEGKVQVHSVRTAGATDHLAVVSPALVQAGERAVVPLAASAPEFSIMQIPTEQIDEKLAWHPRLLDFTEAHLSVVVNEFNRRNSPIRIVIEDAELGDTVVSASLRSDNIESFIRLLEGGFGVKTVRDGNTVTLRKR